MAITLSGDGISSDAIASLAASKLTGQVADAKAPSGSVLQVVSNTKVDTFSTSSTSFIDITGLSATITPISASSRILVMFHFTRGASTAALTAFRLMRDSTPVGNGTPSSNRAGAIVTTYTGTADTDAHCIPTSGTFVDSPSTTSAITYKLQVLCQSGMTLWIGRSARDTDLAEHARTSSTFTVMEIAG